MPDTTDEEPGEDTTRDGPSLELPSLGWRRRRQRSAPAPVAAGQPVAPQTSIAPAETVEPPTAPLTVVPELEPEPEPYVETEPEPAPEPRVRRERGPGGVTVAMLTGLVVGLGIVGLTWASLRLCEGVQGTSSCGDTGYVLLIAILTAMIVVGALLLRLTRVPEPGSTSFLAVGLTAALALLFLVDSLMDRPMVVVIPVLSAGSFAAAHWVTRTFSSASAS